MKLGDLLPGVSVSGGSLSPDTDIHALRIDSRECGPNDLFFARQGLKDDGCRYIPDALAAGAVGVVCERPLDGVPHLQVPDVRKALAVMARAFYGHPDEQIPVIGITGTNGKTTTAHMVAWALGGETACGLIGTVEVSNGRERIPATLTTPESVDIQRHLATMVTSGLHAAAMEVSAHGLSLHRVYGIPFRVGVFTNLSVDHMDYYEDMAGYLDAKLTLFRSLDRNAVAVINTDDDAALTVAQACNCDILRVGHGDGCDVRIRGSVFRDGEQTVSLSVLGEPVSCSIPLPGMHNAMNLAQALAVVVALGKPLAPAVARMSALPAISGRLERVPSQDGVRYYVDFAHTPAGLDQVLRALKAQAQGRLICVFGCGGDRDRTKRPLMLTTVCRHADRVVATADNPRTEPQSRIFDDMRAGETGGRPVSWIEDRREAIRMAVAEARPGDVVLVAGKGHESYQQIGEERFPFSDRDEVLKALGGRGDHAHE